MRHGTRPAPAMAALLGAVVIVATACGGNSSGPGASSPTTTGGGGKSSSSSGNGYGYGGGSSSTSPTSSAGSGGPAAATVVQADYSFSPSKLTVKSGSVIDVQNSSGRTPHTFTIAGSSVDVTNDHGESQKVTISLDPGTYTFFCRFHKSQGMKGTITVT